MSGRTMHTTVAGYPYRLCAKHIKAGRRKVAKAMLRSFFKGVVLSRRPIIDPIALIDPTPFFRRRMRRRYDFWPVERFDSGPRKDEILLGSPPFHFYRF